LLYADNSVTGSEISTDTDRYQMGQDVAFNGSHFFHRNALELRSARTKPNTLCDGSSHKSSQQGSVAFMGRNAIL
jgi:hypothetical protein